MFKVAPQSVPLVVPGSDNPPVMLNFVSGCPDDPADVAKCHLDVVLPSGDTHRAVFNTMGGLCYVTFIEAAPEEPEVYQDDVPSVGEGVADGEEVKEPKRADYQTNPSGEKQPA